MKARDGKNSENVYEKEDRFNVANLTTIQLLDGKSSKNHVFFIKVGHKWPKMVPGRKKHSESARPSCFWWFGGETGLPKCCFWPLATSPSKAHWVQKGHFWTYHLILILGLIWSPLESAQKGRNTIFLQNSHLGLGEVCQIHPGCTRGSRGSIWVVRVNLMW